MPRSRRSMRRTTMAATSLCLLLVSGVRAQPPMPDIRPEIDKKLNAAKTALTGLNKDLPGARGPLLDLANKAELVPPYLLCYVYVYLGYIEDKTGNRRAAVEWYRKALEIKQADGVRNYAKIGVERPITSIKHLDRARDLGNVPSGRPPTTPKRIPVGRGYVTTGDPPTDLEPARVLIKEEQVENFNVLCQAIEQWYTQFDLKSIDWGLTKALYEQRLREPMTVDGFYQLLFELMNELRDTYSYLLNYTPPRPPLDHAPLMQAGFMDNRLVVTSAGGRAAELGLRPGWEIVAVDGVSAWDRATETKRFLRTCSTPWAFTRKACFYLLTGRQGTKATVTVRSPEGEVMDCFLSRDTALQKLPPRPEPLPVTRQQCVHYGTAPSGVGYIHLASMANGATVAAEFDTALEALRDTRALILDLRDNPGGDFSANEHVISRLLTERRRIARLYWKAGPGPNEFRRCDYMAAPAGPWQYDRPVALLVNAVTAGAAEVLASEFLCCFRAITVGERTHGTQGAFPGTSAYAVLPCNLVARLSRGYVCGKEDRPLEGRSIWVETPVSPSPDDLLKGTDVVFEKAVAILSQPGFDPDLDPSDEVEEYYAGVDPAIKATLRRMIADFARKGLCVSERAFRKLTPEQLAGKRREWLAALDNKTGQELHLATECLGATRSTQALAKLTELATQPGGGRTRWLATRALGRLDDKRAVPALIGLTTDRQRDVQRWAQASLYRLTGQWFGADQNKWRQWWREHGKE